MTASTSCADLTLYRRLFRQARPYWPHLLGVGLLSLLSPPLALLIPLPLKIAVDSIIGSRPIPDFLDVVLPAAASGSTPGMLMLVTCLTVAIGLLIHLQGLASWLLHTYTGEKLVLSFRTQLFGHVQRLSLSYHDTKGTTDSTYRIQYDAPAIQWILINGITPFLTSSLMLAGMAYITARIDWQLALVALGVLPVLFLLRRSSSRRLRTRWYEVKEYESSAMSVVQEALAALRVVKAFGQETREQERFIHHASKGVRGQVRLAFIEGGFDLLTGLTMAMGTAAVLLIGVLHVQASRLTLGDLLLVMAYLAQLYGPLESMTKKVAGLQSSMASAERAFSLLDEVSDVPERPDARPISRAAGAIKFRKVSFAYNTSQPVLQDISFEIAAGTRVGIIGTTGAGKSTLVSLLTRFYDPTTGQVLLDGIDLRDYRIADLRNQVAIVLQDPVLFATTIEENIAYARPSATRSEIIDAANAANAHDFIMSLPMGYDTQVGERGMRLSGGERQRISIARAFLKDAPILILDEPTSSIDMHTEARIMEAMVRLMMGRTAFIIAHRLSTLKHCHVILEIESGRLVAVTSHVPPGAGEAFPSGRVEAAATRE